MLSLDSSQYGHLLKAFEARAPLTPAWVWLPWIPQLLTSLCRAEAHSIQTVLMNIVKCHPQALYFTLRAFFLERRDIERAIDPSSGLKQDDDAQKHAEILMSNLRKLHPTLWSRLEAILEDLIIRFRPSYESELLATIKALLERANTKTEQKSAGKDETADCNAILLESLRGNLSKISHKFFNKDKPESSKGRKALLFEKKWHSAFDRDFVDKRTGPDGDHQGPASIEELVEKLESWKAKLERHVSLAPLKCHLQETSPSLSWYSGQSSDLWAGACESASLAVSNAQDDYDFDNALYEATRSSALAAYKASSEAVVSTAKAEGLGGHEGGGSALVEIPGQYAPTSSSALDTRPFPELHAKLIHFHQTLEVVSSPSKQDQMVRQITMIGSDGKKYRFSLELAIPYWTRTDERSAQLQYVMNNILQKDIQTSRRYLSVRPNVVIPVAQRMRMTANEPSFTSLDSLSSHVKGPDMSRIATFFEEEVEKRLANVEGDDKDSKAIHNVKLEVYRHICQELVPQNILSKYMMNAIPSIEQLVQYRKVFASQLALNSVLQHAFAVVERNPSRFVFCNSSGRVLTQDFRCQYNQGKVIDAFVLDYGL
jgi:transformation/transcription domain-associated protein